MRLTTQEKADLRLALHLAIEWEITVVQSQEGVDFMKEHTDRSKDNIKRFKALKAKIR